MKNRRSSSTNVIPPESQQPLSNRVTNKRRKKNNIRKRMKNCLFCGLAQKKSPSPTFIAPISSEIGSDPNPNMVDPIANDVQTEWHSTDCNNVTFTIPKRYQNLTHIGRGAFGAVARATDTETGKLVAIKKMLHPFQTPTHAKRAYRELKLLMDLNHPDAQIIQLHNVFTPDKDVRNFQTLYFVFNFVDYDLNRVIKRRIPFKEEHVRQIIYSLLRGVKYMHSAGVLHRDLKPVNIGIDRDSNVTIFDFGLARVASDGVHTGYVATRWWRAPEVYVNWERYDEKLDVWSIGCIMGELITLHPLFPGNDLTDQLNKIFGIIGTPKIEVLEEICTEDARRYISALPKRTKQNFNDLFGYKYKHGSSTPISGVSPDGVDLLDRLLNFDYRSRPTAEEALEHPYLKDYHESGDEPTMNPVVDEHQDATYSTSQWKSIVWQMVHAFQPPSFDENDSDDDANDQAMTE